MNLALSSCQLTKDGRVVVIGSWDNTVYSYSVEYGRVLDSFSGHDDAVSCLRLLPGDDYLVTGSWDASVRLWPYRSTNGGARAAQQVTLLLEGDSQINCIDCNPAGNLVCAGSADGLIAFLDTRQETPVNLVQAHTDAVRGLRFTSDGSRVITCSDDAHLKIWRVGSGGIASAEMSLSAPAKSLWLGDGPLALVGTDAGVVELWDLTEGAAEHVGDLPGPAGSTELSSITCVCAPELRNISDGTSAPSVVVCGDNSGTIGCWSLS